MSTRREHQTLPLSVLLKRELANEKIEKPELVYGQAGQRKNGEDFTLIKTECQRAMGDGVATFSLLGFFDGHNESTAAFYTKENLLNNMLNAIPPDLSRDDWTAALPRALVAGFVKTDKDFQQKAQPSGTTVTFVIIDGWVISVASVGESHCILESAEGGIYYLSADYRLESNDKERNRITASGGEVGRLNSGGGADIGPLRCCPGGLCLSRSIGDRDMGEFIVAILYVKQVKDHYSSDGVWDALSAEMALDCCCATAPYAAAKQIVKEAVQAKGLQDDTTCIVVDILQQEKPTASPLPSTKKPGKGIFKSMFRKKSTESSSYRDKEYIELDVVVLFEEGCAMLSERLHTNYALCNMFKLFICAICQVEIKPGEGTSIHAGSSYSFEEHHWDGPFLCSSCQERSHGREKAAVR